MGQESQPPPRRSVVFPMLAPVSAEDHKSEFNGMRQSLQKTQSSPALMVMSASFRGGESMRHGRRNKSSLMSGTTDTANVCKELDEFEAKASDAAVARISNFFNTPRATREVVVREQ